MFKIVLCALALIPLALVVRNKRLRFEPIALVLAVLFALFQVVGHSYEHYGTFRAIFDVPAEAALALAAMVFYTSCLYCALALAFSWADAAAGRAAERVKAGSLARFLPFWATALMLLLAWLPYLIVFAPGSFTYDGIFQMDMWHGFAPATDHHPWVMTALMGCVFDIGRMLGSDNLGVALWVGAQSIVQAIALAASVSCMRRMGASTPVLAVALAFFAIAPAWGTYAQAFLKDTLFASLFCLYVLLLAEHWMHARRSGDVRPRLLVMLVLVGIALCLSRHNGAYVVVLTMPFVIASMPRHVRMKVTGACLAPLVVFVLVSRVVYPAMDIIPSGKQETLGALFQQTARFIKEAPDDVSDAEREAIAAVLDYNALPDLYYGSRSDAVKATYTGNDEALGDYLAAWASMGIRHPSIYVDAFLNGCYGYFYADESWTHNTWDYRLYNYGSIPGIEDDFDVSYVFDENARGAVIAFCNGWQNVPLLGLTGHCGIYTWLLLIAAGYVIRTMRWRTLFVLVPSLVLLLICCVSPVNGYLRYMLPIMAALPLQMWFCVAASERVPKRR
ncbi:MAG: DUF6020 family protein [Slackia sp.]|nr:DUF6020 family protein [Slackia sp.]